MVYIKNRYKKIRKQILYVVIFWTNITVDKRIILRLLWRFLVAAPNTCVHHKPHRGINLTFQALRTQAKKGFGCKMHQTCFKGNC